MPASGQRSGKPVRPGQAGWRRARAARAKLAAGGLTHQEERRLRAIGRARDKATRRRNLELGHIGLAVAGAIAVMAVVAVAFSLGPALEAAGGHGASGTFIVGYQVCFRGCSWVGTFDSATGQVIPDVTYDGGLPPGARPGHGIPAIHPGGSRQVFAPHGSHVWLADVLVMVVVGGAAALALWISPIRVSRRRNQELQDRGPAG
jgi:hypothetical protein